MEKENQVFPNIELFTFPRIAGVSRFILNVVRMPHTLATHGDHFVEKRGAAEQLDKAIYDTRPPCLNRWDDMGSYYEDEV